ncbi:MAG: DUF1211 domain-containing protein [Anaerolineales bacterium]|uniref:TMEM175 family protein n=1 Tax=Promineifilum sp. TaxID=2664178 RepID=UPI001D589E40|nr:DUF1211 domain-containing protein [Anaerolineales bacterium]MCO5180666.1 TMEM175 family protein [Promineifilum sp.]
MRINITKRSPLLFDDETGLERIIFFSDAVFAIAITLLALEIRLPSLPAQATNAQLLAALGALGPRYLSYAISFLVIGLLWLGHHRAFRHVHQYSNRLIFLNILFLLVIGFLPFPTAVIGEFGNAVGTIFYAAAMAAAGLLLALLGRYLGAEGHFLWMPAVFLLSIPLALWSPDAAKYAWLLIMLPVFWHPAAETRGARRVDHGSVGRG